MKYFMHRIQEEDGVITKGIEVHDTLDAASLSYWGRVKLAYNSQQHPKMSFVSVKITDETGAVVEPYNLTWQKEAPEANRFFLHHIRKDGETFDKGIDTFASFDEARTAFAEAMEYGYGNSKFPNVSLVSCEITDMDGRVMTPFAETWTRAETEPGE